MKKGLLIASIASVTAVAGGLAFAVANANKGIRYEAVKASAKSIVFDSSTNIPSGTAGEYDKSGYSSYEAVPTLAGDPVITKAYAYSNGSSRVAQFGERVVSEEEAQAKPGINAGTYDHFMTFAYSRTSEYNGSFYVEVGVNNATSFSISLGTRKAYKLQCDVELMSTTYYDGMEIIKTEQYISENDGPFTDTFAKDISLGQEVHYIRFHVYCQSSGTWYIGDHFINSISLSWSC